jgi:hypothetical protein
MPPSCASCHAPLAEDQRYCLECGARHGEPRLDWRALVVGSAAPAVVADLPAADPPAVPILRMPGPRVAAVLVLGTLAFGAVVGHDIGPGAAPADAGRRPNLTILAAAPPALAPPPIVAPVTPTVPTAPDASAPPDTSGSATTPPDTSSSSSGATGGGATTTSDTPATAPPSPGGNGTSGTDTSTTPSAPAKVPPVKHVWVVSLTGHSYEETFGPDSPAPYLAQELRAKGTLLPWYLAAGHDPSAGGVALLGGQKDATGPFPASVQTLADQLTGAGRTWKAYIEGATDGLNPGDNPCSRPPEQAPRNPFLRFASISGAPECGSSIAGIDAIANDVQTSDSAPAFSYILPAAANDGSTNLADADAWLRTTVQPILDSKAYADGGLIVITFDSGASDDVRAGGGRVGALLLSSFVTPGGTVSAPYDPFTLLRSVEELFGLDALGYAKDTHLKPFGPKIYAAWDPAKAAPASQGQ